MATHSQSGHGRASAGRDLDFFRENGYTPVPQFIQWMATLRCELACPHCLAADGSGAPDMPLREVARLLDQVADMRIPRFLITGGEPAGRPDLPEVVDMLRERGQGWEINTAANPGTRLRAAMERHPPGFAAVSLDGPQRVHDDFRGRGGAHEDALRAIRFYREIVDGEVAAGTTVTSHNYGHLSETFAEVIASGATAWGLHLLVPEGRAAESRRLFLSRRQLRGLIDFCAAKRNHFPVGMADEIGYLGEEEPLVRDYPFLCGAGRTQCVVLPGGELVPCTTLDRRASAGNVLRRPLREVWAEGFAALRSWRPEGRCRSCEYARACGGGCWLQRKNGTQCFRHVWRAPRLAGAAAGLAVCFGLGPAASAGEPAKKPAGKQKGSDEAISDIPLGGPGVVGAIGVGGGKLTPEERKRFAKCAAESWIVRWYAHGAHRDRRRAYHEALRKSLRAKIKETPAADYLAGFIDLASKRDLDARCRAVRAGLKTEQVSLSLAALMWRDLAEVCMDGKSAEKRSPKERRLLRSTLTALEARTAEWYRQTLKERLWPFLRRRAHTFGYKGGPPREYRLAGNLRRKRRGNVAVFNEEFVKAHPFAESMQLRLGCDAESGLVLLRGGPEEKPGAKFHLRIFDLIKTPPAKDAKTVTLTVFGSHGELRAELPAGCELTYADVLQLTYNQNRAGLDGALAKHLRRYGRDISPLLLPALRAAAGEAKVPVAKDRAVRVKSLIVDLGADAWKEREAASMALEKIGKAALPALREATGSKDAEVAQRARRIIEKLKAPKRDARTIRTCLTDLWMF